MVDVLQEQMVVPTCEHCDYISELGNIATMPWGRLNMLTLSYMLLVFILLLLFILDGS